VCRSREEGHACPGDGPRVAHCQSHAGSMREPSTALQRSGLSHGVSWEMVPYTVSEFLSVVTRGSPRVPVGTGTQGTRIKITRSTRGMPAAGRETATAGIPSRRRACPWSATPRELTWRDTCAAHDPPPLRPSTWPSRSRGLPEAPAVDRKFGNLSTAPGGAR
jgi:hypothetical protein